MAWDKKVPFNRVTKCLLHHHSDARPSDIEWRDQEPFVAHLTYLEYRRGRSAAYFVLRCQETNRDYTMFMTDFDKIVHLFERGAIRGKWLPVKRGQNYGIQLQDKME